MPRRYATLNYRDLLTGNSQAKCYDLAFKATLQHVCRNETCRMIKSTNMTFYEARSTFSNYH